MNRIAIFASGNGSNADRIARHFSASGIGRVNLILCNNQKAGVIKIASSLNIPCVLFNRKDLYESEVVVKALKEKKINFVVLAGFLWKIPGNIISDYPGSIVNIHPALLPAHGGSGFYGIRVHQSVIESGVRMSGITIHHVNDQFDEGEIIFQAACHVSKDDTAETLAEKIHSLEHQYFPVVIEKMLQQHGLKGS